MTNPTCVHCHSPLLVSHDKIALYWCVTCDTSMNKAQYDAYILPKLAKLAERRRKLDAQMSQVFASNNQSCSV